MSDLVLVCVDVVPQSREFEVGRTSLIPGLLKALRTNRSAALPLRLFQADDVLLRDGRAETGARNERRVCAAFCDRGAGLEHVHGLLDRLCQAVAMPLPAYVLRDADHPAFFPGRCVSVVLRDGAVLGVMGVIHPLVLKAFQLPNPVSLFEINLETLEKFRK